MKERVPFRGKAQRAGLKLRDRCEYGQGKVTPEPPTDDPFLREGRLGRDPSVTGERISRVCDKWVV